MLTDIPWIGASRFGEGRDWLMFSIPGCLAACRLCICGCAYFAATGLVCQFVILYHDRVEALRFV